MKKQLYKKSKLRQVGLFLVQQNHVQGQKFCLNWGGTHWNKDATNIV